MRTRETYEDWQAVETENDVARAMQTARQMALNVADGRDRAAYFCGPPGVGKTEAIRTGIAVFEARGAKPVFANPRSYLELLRAFEKAGKRRPLVMEEADVVFRTDRMLNLLKRATEVKASDRVYDGVRLDSPIFISTNHDLADLASFHKDLREDAKALFDRTPPCVIPSGDRLDLWEYSIFIAQTTRMLWSDRQGNGIPFATRNRAIEWFTLNVWRLSNVSPRSLYRAADLMSVFRDNPHHLQERLAALLLPSPVSSQRPPLVPTLVSPISKVAA